MIDENPDVATMIVHDPKARIIEAKQHNTHLHMLIIMTGCLSRSEEDAAVIAKLLLDAGADPNAQNDRGETPLHLACETTNRSAEMAQVLLEHGADPHIVTKKGEGVFDLLHADEESDLIRKMLEEHGKKSRK